MVKNMKKSLNQVHFKAEIVKFPPKYLDILFSPYLGNAKPFLKTGVKCTHRRTVLSLFQLPYKDEKKAIFWDVLQAHGFVDKQGHQGHTYSL